MAIKNLVIVTRNYPTKLHPGSGTFVKELTLAFARLGKHCTVIHPINIFNSLRGQLPPYQDLEIEANNAPITVLSPRYLSFSNKKILSFNSGILTQWAFEQAALKAYLQIRDQPDAIYGHFLYPGGGTAAKLGRKFSVPAFAAVGEGIFWTVEPLGYDQAQRDFETIFGIVAVSTLLKKKIISQIGVPGDKIRVFPNGVDLTKFYPSNKSEAREKLNLPLGLFIVVFVGKFDQNKGVLSVVESLKDIPGTGMVLLGSGTHDPSAPNILFKGQVVHRKVPEYLSAADVFLLPTGHEGSCNSILEAMACGLPIITSVGEFNDDIVDETNAIRIDPQDIDAIRNAVLLLKENKLMRMKLSAGSQQKAKEFDINQRAQGILSWMEQRIQSSSN